MIDVKKIRQSIGKTQTELAKMLNVSQGTVQKWEAGDRSPGVKSALKLKKIQHKSSQNSVLKKSNLDYRSKKDDEIASLQFQVDNLNKEVALLKQKIDNMELNMLSEDLIKHYVSEIKKEVDALKGTS